MMSMANSKCLDEIVPRTPECLQLDELHRVGIRSLTKAIALDPDFGPAYALRASALYKMKQHRQAIRDFDKALAFHNPGQNARKFQDGTQEFNSGHPHRLSGTKRKNTSGRAVQLLHGLAA
jgi:tetratricopeptide (TPR) repeat protein